MDSSRGRKRRKKRVEYDDVVPSTDLPPLVEGELRCFLFVTVGELVWGTTATYKVPPASPVYIRLRWWGEASNGTYFRPSTVKSQKTIKSRAQFGIRSGPTQISAYFNDMGSATFDILSSPTSLPIGRVLVPGVSTLSSSSPIRGYFPIISASSRKLGELQISISFKPLRAAYEDLSDTVTDGSMSIRSRTSIGGRGSRQSSRSRASSIASSKSRSSSRDSKRSNSRNLSNNKLSKNKRSKQKLRSRSRSGESKVSFDLSQNEVPTPRGVDKLLEQNGLDLYGRNGGLVTTGQDNEIPIKTTVSMSRPTESAHADAIGELLKRGRKLRDEIIQTGVQNPVPTSSYSQIYSTDQAPKPVHEQPLQVPIPSALPAQPRSLPATTTTVTASKSAPLLSTTLQPQQNSNMDDRILDMVFKAKGFKNIDFASPDVSSMSSPQCSLVSDLDDPLHDESILQHLFYNQENDKIHKQPKTCLKSQDAPTNDQLLNSSYMPREQNLEVSRMNPNPTHYLSHQEMNSKLQSVNVVRISVHNLLLSSSPDLQDELNRTNKESFNKREKGKKGKPPMSASPFSAQNFGKTYFVEYKFPHTVSNQRSIAVTTSNHELTRVASRKLTKTGSVKFDQHSHFNIRFNPATIDKWSSSNLEFVVYHKRPKDKKAVILGIGSISLRDVITTPKLSRSELLKISPRTSDSHLNTKVLGTLKITIDLVNDAKDLSTLTSPSKKANPSYLPQSFNENLPPERDESTYDNRANLKTYSVAPTFTNDTESPHICVEDGVQPEEDSVCPRLASTVLYLYIMLDKGRNIPATKLQSGPNSGKSCFPNVYLVCRTFASDEVIKTAVVWNTSNPNFAFTQVIPVKINKQLFTRLRNNYVVVEVWTKIPSEQKFSDKLMGLVKIPLHLFYQSLKDSDVARAVLKSNYPLISVDGFQPIVDVFTGHERGQLKLLLALGSQLQVNAMRKTKGIEDKVTHHLDDNCEDDNDDRNDEHTHLFQITINGLQGFQPHNTQVWGETDCFVQYQFPTQRKITNNEEDNDEKPTDDQDGVSMEYYRSDTTLCIPNPQFNFTKKHSFQPPPSTPLQNLLFSASSNNGDSPASINFEIWSRYYYPNVRDQLLAKGFLPLAKLTALVTMLGKLKVVEQTFQVPLKFVDTESESQSAGDLNLTLKYKSSKASKVDLHQACLPFYKNVKIQVAVLRACGLKAAAKLKASLVDDTKLEHSSQVGVNSYVKIRPSFLAKEKPRQTRCMARSFAPDYNHQFEFDCPVIFHDEDQPPTSLAALLASGEIVAEIWHKPIVEDIDGNFKADNDVLLGRIQIPTGSLLYKTTGFGSWYSITSMESLQHRSSSNVGAVEIAASFTCRSDLELVLRAAKALGWAPALKSDLNRLLVPNYSGVLAPIDDSDLQEGSLTTCITVTNAWLPRDLLTLPGSDEISKHAHVFLRYKFYDKDTVISSVCPVSSASEKNTFKQHEMFPVKLAHRKSFLCKANQPLVWYLREEILEIQLWLSYSRSSRTRKRPFDYDRLLGAAVVDMSGVLVGGLYRQQHISGLYPLFKAGVDDLGDASLRIYFSVNPGDHTRLFDEDELDETSATLSSTDTGATPTKDNDRKASKKRKSRHKINSDRFSAIVSVERAMHLASLPISDPEMHPSCYVTYPVAGSSESIESTKTVPRSTCPVWDDTREVMLDRKILDKDSGSLFFRVWQRDSDPEKQSTDDESKESSDKVIGFATVDVSLLLAGFRAVNGWYNVLDIHGQCQGQIKVAITPTDPMYLNPSGNVPAEQSSTNVALSPRKSLLYSVPLWEPVETPSGSMYYPGVSKTSLDNDSNKTSTTALPPNSSSQPVEQNKVPATSSRVSFDAIPRRSLFHHDPQPSLQSILHKQMLELDQIKENFQQRLNNVLGTDSDKQPDDSMPPLSVSFPTVPPNVAFSSSSVIAQDSRSVFSVDPSLRSTVSSDPTSYSISSSLPNSNEVKNSVDPENNASKQITTPDIPPGTGFSEQELIASTTLVPSDTLLIEQAGDKKLESSTPDFPRSKSSVHLSLFKPKKAYYDGTVLSDNDLSDVELIQPRSLNGDGDLPDVDLRSTDVLANFTDKNPEDSFSASFVVSPPETKSSDRPEMDNTSLWLSASSSHLENTNKTDIDAPELGDTDKDDVENVDTVVKQFVTTDVLDGETNNDQKYAEKMIFESDIKSELNLSFDEESLDVGSEEEDEGSDYTIKNEDDIEEPSCSSTTSPTLQTEEDEDQNDDGKPLSSQLQAKLNEDEVIKSLSTNLKEISKTITSEATDVVLAPPVDSGLGFDGQLPSSSSKPSTHLCPSSGITQIPSFFPPQQDLLASMKALQAITTEQKSKLLKQEKAENKENSFSSPTESRPRRKVVRPVAHTAEQTERLARIFNTKYST